MIKKEQALPLLFSLFPVSKCDGVHSQLSSATWQETSNKAEYM